MGTIFNQIDFSGGLNAKFDPTKELPNEYPLGVNIRIRKNVVEPIQNHLQLDAPAGVKNGICALGSVVVLFAAGNAYYLDIEAGSNQFQLVSGWTTMDTAADVFTQLVPASDNVYARQLFDDGNISILKETFPGSVASFPEALFVQSDSGVDRPQRITANFAASPLGDYSDWTVTVPEYVPIGKQMAAAGNKLFLVSPNGTTIFHSVTGRCNDFGVNVDGDGKIAGEANTVDVATSFDPATALKAIDNGNVIVGTLHAIFPIILNYDKEIFGEPFLQAPGPFFPIGVVNQKSFARLLGDTAFISQNGIQSFNAVQQTQTESNNDPVGSKIRDILRNPQSETAAENYDNYALFSVNTRYGRGVMVYDTTLNVFTSLDLSFGHAKQFAVVKVAGKERIFFIDTDDNVFEAFAADETATAQVYLGELTSKVPNTQTRVDAVNLIFTEIVRSGHVRVSVFVDGEELYAATQALEASETTEALDSDVPFNSRLSAKPLTFKFPSAFQGWKVGILIQWTASAALANASIEGDYVTLSNPSGEAEELIEPEKFALIGGVHLGEEIVPPGGSGCVVIPANRWYVFNPRGHETKLVYGDKQFSETSIVFIETESIWLTGTGASLRDCTDIYEMFLRIAAEKPTAVIGLGDMAFEDGGADDVADVFAFFSRYEFFGLAGDIEYDTDDAKAWWAANRNPRYYAKDYRNVRFVAYNGGWNSTNVPVDSDGITTGPTSEPDGNDQDSVQGFWARSVLRASTKRFNFVLVHEPPYSISASNSPGWADLRLTWRAYGADGVISGHDKAFTRLTRGGLLYLNQGLGASDTSESLKPLTTDYDTFIGSGLSYTILEVDGVVAKFTTKSVSTGAVIDTHTITA